jgi:hypothetical protein
MVFLSTTGEGRGPRPVESSDSICRAIRAATPVRQDEQIVVNPPTARPARVAEAASRRVVLDEKARAYPSTLAIAASTSSTARRVSIGSGRFSSSISATLRPSSGLPAARCAGFGSKTPPGVRLPAREPRTSTDDRSARQPERGQGTPSRAPGSPPGGRLRRRSRPSSRAEGIPTQRREDDAVARSRSRPTRCDTKCGDMTSRRPGADPGRPARCPPAGPARWAHPRIPPSR